MRHKLLPRLLLLLVAPAQQQPQCEPRDTFVVIDFSSSRLVRSNLGGLGGRCDSNAALCTEGMRTSSTPHDLTIEDVGYAHGGATLGSGGSQSITLQITNQSEYRAWNTNVNGVKRQRVPHRL